MTDKVGFVTLVAAILLGMAAIFPPAQAAEVYVGPFGRVYTAPQVRVYSAPPVLYSGPQVTVYRRPLSVFVNPAPQVRTYYYSAPQVYSVPAGEYETVVGPFGRRLWIVPK